MELNAQKHIALLSWINNVNTESHLKKLVDLMEGHRLLQLVYKVQRKVFRDSLSVSTSLNEMEMIFKLLQEDFGLVSRQAVRMLQKMSRGVELEIQLAKVVLVLCYCAFKLQNVPLLDTEAEIMIVSMFNFVHEDADGLSLDGGLDRFLTKSSVFTFSTSSMESRSPLSTSESPHFSPFKTPPRAHFQEVFTVACSSKGAHEVLKHCQNFKTDDLLNGKIESLQTQILHLSKKISLKDEEIRNLRNECETADHELKLVKEQNIEINEIMKSNRKEHEGTVRKLQQELHSASSAASYEKEKMVLLVASLKEQVSHYSENEVQKQKELSALKEKLTSVQNQLTEAKQSELQRELRHQDTLKNKDTQISALEAQMKEQQLRSERLRAQLELKVKNQNSSILALKNLACRFEQQNKELVEKLDVMVKQLQHYSAKHQEAQKMNRSLEKSLQASRRKVQDLQTKVYFASALTEQRNDTENSRHRECLIAPETRPDLSDDCFELDTPINANAYDYGVQNEADHDADDWMRVAELQARNEACLPHLKSCYPLESRPTTGKKDLTDEDLRMGDPRETIHRTALHLHDSQNGHTPQPHKHTGAQLNPLSAPEQRQSLMFMIANTPKKHNGDSLLHRGLKRRQDACRSPTVFSGALRPSVRAGNSRSPKSSSAKQGAGMK